MEGANVGLKWVLMFSIAGSRRGEKGYIEGPHYPERVLCSLRYNWLGRVHALPGCFLLDQEPKMLDPSVKEEFRKTFIICPTHKISLCDLVPGGPSCQRSSQNASAKLNPSGEAEELATRDTWREVEAHRKESHLCCLAVIIISSV
ncbi:hypothetical protein CRENBAI_001686 [Crenichthys baileyi]|uniref:Uncharacterized protein n=1 Tax=Crenichthys baileyi TaxID=28760 RepID=A0AAV9RH83_9TELE